MTVQIIDVSNNNKSVDIATIARSRLVDGVLHKATEGRGFADKFFVPRHAVADQHRLPFGGYHFARPDQNPTPAGAVAEAIHFCEVLGRVGRRDLRPALDYETRCKLTAKEQLIWVQTFNHEVHRRTGIWPLFYSYFALIQELQFPEPVGDGLWLAELEPAAASPFTIPAPWKRAVLHQFTWNAQIAGVQGRCDLSAAPSLRPLLAHPLLGLL